VYGSEVTVVLGNIFGNVLLILIYM